MPHQLKQYGKYGGYASSRWAMYRWEIRHWWYSHITGPLFGNYRTWRHEAPEYRALMTDLGRSFLMREMRLRRLPGALRVQQTYRRYRPAQEPELSYPAPHPTFQPGPGSDEPGGGSKSFTKLNGTTEYYD